MAESLPECLWSLSAVHIYDFILHRETPAVVPQTDVVVLGLCWRCIASGLPAF